MPAVIVRTLTREYRLVTPSAAIAQSLAFVAIAPEIAGVRLEPVEIPVEEDGAFLRLRLPDGSLAEGTSAHIVSRLHGLILSDILESEPKSPLIHGATLVHHSRRLLLVGSKGSGKSTLALYALAHGFDVEGDEHLVVRSGGVIARPRTLRIKMGSFAYVPELAPALERCPRILNWDGTPIVAVDPSIAGRPWRIAEGALDGLIFIEPNHGGRSVMRELSKNDAFRRILDEALVAPGQIGSGAARLRQLVTRVRTLRLQTGDLPRAVWHLGHIHDWL